MERLKHLLFDDKAEWVGPKIWKFLLENPTILLTILYLLLSGLGLLYQYVLFAQFGINVIDYSEAEDFFLAAFKSPDAFFSGFAIVGSLVIYRLVANYARQRQNFVIRGVLLFFSWIGLLRREILIPLGAIYFFYFFAFAAEIEARRLVEESNDAVKVTTRSGELTKYEVVPIGSTESFIFGIDLNKDLVAARERKDGSAYKPIIRAFPFGDIVRLDYNQREFRFSRFSRARTPNDAVERDAPQAARPSP